MLWFGLKQKVEEQEQKLEEYVKVLGGVIGWLEKQQKLNELQETINQRFLNKAEIKNARVNQR